MNVEKELKTAADFFGKEGFSALKLTDDEVRRASMTFADAFSEYYMIDWMHKCKGTDAKLRAFFEMEFRANKNGSIFLADSSDFNSFALLKPDCGDPASFISYVMNVGKVISESGIASLMRMIRYSEAMVKYRLSLVGKKPWYLYYLGTKKSGQGKGYGSALLRRITAYMDMLESDIYVETNDLENTRFYRTFGFKEIGSFDYADFKCYCMLRNPKKS